MAMAVDHRLTTGVDGPQDPPPHPTGPLTRHAPSLAVRPVVRESSAWSPVTAQGYPVEGPALQTPCHRFGWSDRSDRLPEAGHFENHVAAGLDQNRQVLSPKPFQVHG